MFKKSFVNLIKNIIFYLLNFIYKIIYFIMLIFPVKNNWIFINCFDGKGIGDNPKYIINELLHQDSNYEVVWLSNRKEVSDFDVKFVKPYSIQSLYTMATSKIWISTVRMPYYSIKRKNQYYIQTWHGCVALKRVEKDCENALSSRYIHTAKHDSKMINVFISNSAFCTKMYKRAFWYDGLVKEIGCPRNDILLNVNRFESTLRLKYSFQGKKIVLYAPTFRKTNSFEKYNIDYDRLRQNLSKRFGGEWVVALRLHPRLSVIANSYIKYDENLINVSMHSDCQELLAVADVVVTDYSSVMFDYMLTNRPVFIYANDIDEYIADRNFYFELHSLPFLLSTSNDQLENNILNFNESNYNNKLDFFKNQLELCENGTASKEVAKLIMRNCDQ